MLSGKLTKYGIRLALALILGLALFASSPIPAYAEAPIDLVLDGEGATSWNIENIKPGDSGTKTVELHNAGSRHGSVTIWISDIDEVDHGGDGAALDNYLLFNLSCERLSSNIALPVTIHELPQSASDPNYLKINTLLAGETVTIVWEWEFLETGEAQNDAQGDSLSFSINYLLEESSSGDGDGGTVSYQQLEIDILGKVTVAKVSSSGRLYGSCLATDPDNKHTLEFNRGTRITCADGRVPRRIEMRLCEESLSPPEGMEMIGPAYDLTGYISGSVSCPLIFNTPVELTLSYDPDWLPENALSILISSYKAGYGWAELEPADGGVAQGNKATVLISHTSIFAILAKIVPSPSPAEFKLSEFAINPAQMEVGEPVTISVVVQNTGELEGSYTLTLKINGEIEQSTEVTLAGGESRRISFTVVKNEPGTYGVAIDVLTGEFIVLASTASPAWGDTYWWVILLVVGIIGPVVYLLAMRPKNRR